MILYMHLDCESMIIKLFHYITYFLKFIIATPIKISIVPAIFDKVKDSLNINTANINVATHITPVVTGTIYVRSNFDIKNIYIKKLHI